MSSANKIFPFRILGSQEPVEWDFVYWQNFDATLRSRALRKETEAEIQNILTNGARTVMRKYTTSFYLVSRFLPPEKRKKVEAIYAAVRYPDEIVDTFPIQANTKLRLLDEWSEWYDKALGLDSIRESLLSGVPSFVSSFTHVVKETGIPPHYYHSFIDAMRKDTRETYYENMNNLIDSYIYGSAIVVGYFLAHVYGTAKPYDFDRALLASRNLGIALQLTNFMRDIAQDHQRKRNYIPLDILRRYGLTKNYIRNEHTTHLLKQVINEVLDIAEDYYSQANLHLDAFAEDCQTAIRACIDVYRELNSMIHKSGDSLSKRLSVPLIQKFRVLPTSKYWRIPSAIIFGT